MDSHGFEFAWRIWCLDIVQVLRVLQRVNSKLLSSPPFHPYLWCLQGMLNQSSDVNCIWLILIVFVFLKILTVWDTLGNFEGPSAERQCGPAKRSVQITGTLICHQTGLRSSHKTTQNHIKIQKKIQKNTNNIKIKINFYKRCIKIHAYANKYITLHFIDYFLNYINT